MLSNRFSLYKKLQEIPNGKVTTYGALAEYFQTSPRAIASMLSANTEMDLYPCYKVVHTDGKIGGYRGGVEQKIKKLKADGITLIEGERVDLGKFGWKM